MCKDNDAAPLQQRQGKPPKKDLVFPYHINTIFVYTTRRWSRLIVGLLVIVIPLRVPSQTIDKPDVKAVRSSLPVFDAVSIRINKTGDRSANSSSTLSTFTATNVDIKMLLTSAYGIKDHLVSGWPTWADSDHFNVQAKVVEPDFDILKSLTYKERQLMLQQVLEDRFHLKVHQETKILPVYEMLVAKGGLKLKEVSDKIEAPNVGNISSRDGLFIAQAALMTQVASNLSYELHKTVIDKTGLPGRYSFSVSCTFDEGSPDSTEKSSEPTPPSIFTVFQEQLGLKLLPAKGPVEVLVIDSIQLPSAN